MVAVQNTALDARQPQPNCGNGPLHISDVLDELFERLPLPSPEIEPLAVAEPVAA